MTINRPQISDSASLSLAQACRVLEVSPNTLRAWATSLGVLRNKNNRFSGKQIKKIWIYHA